MMDFQPQGAAGGNEWSRSARRPPSAKSPRADAPRPPHSQPPTEQQGRQQEGANWANRDAHVCEVSCVTA